VKAPHLHWPRLDADLYLPALMEGVIGSRRWMARVMGKAGGRSTRQQSSPPLVRTVDSAGGRASLTMLVVSFKRKGWL
jgi:hypothetical protein